jgi:hypothetical protein
MLDWMNNWYEYPITGSSGVKLKFIMAKRNREALREWKKKRPIHLKKAWMARFLVSLNIYFSLQRIGFFAGFSIARVIARDDLWHFHSACRRVV